MTARTENIAPFASAAALALALGCAPESHAFNLWGCLTWPSHPTLHTNTSTPTALRGEVTQAMQAWNAVGGVKRRMNHGGTTGNDFANGCFDDEWWCDDDDGYNVIDWWTRHTGGANAIARIIDVQNTDQCYIAEVDVEINNSLPFAVNPTATELSYQSTLTHELGHLLGIAHSSEDETLAGGDPLRRTTMWYAGAGYGNSWKNTLNVDDINAFRARAPLSNPNEGWSPEIHPNLAWNNHWKYGSTANATNGGLSFYLNPKRTNSNPEAWVAPVKFTMVSIQNSNSVIGGESKWVDEWTNISWREFDRNHSMIITLQLLFPGGTMRELHYARNASNWWHIQGWVCMNGCAGLPNNPSSFNTEVAITRNLFADYASEYPGTAMPTHVSGIFVKHFVNLYWNTDAGGYIKDFYLGSNTN